MGEHDVSPLCPDCGHPVADHAGDLSLGLMCTVDDCGCVGLTNDDGPEFR
jgi:hypothetical protein